MGVTERDARPRRKHVSVGNVGKKHARSRRVEHVRGSWSALSQGGIEESRAGTGVVPVRRRKPVSGGRLPLHGNRARIVSGRKGVRESPVVNGIGRVFQYDVRGLRRRERQRGIRNVGHYGGRKKVRRIGRIRSGDKEISVPGNAFPIRNDERSRSERRCSIDFKSGKIQRIRSEVAKLEILRLRRARSRPHDFVNHNGCGNLYVKRSSLLVSEGVGNESGYGRNFGGSVRYRAGHRNFDFHARAVRRYGRNRRAREREPAGSRSSGKRFGQRRHHLRTIVTGGNDDGSYGVIGIRRGGLRGEDVSGSVREGGVRNPHGGGGGSIRRSAFGKRHEHSGARRRVTGYRISRNRSGYAGDVAVQALRERNGYAVDFSVEIRVDGFSRNDFRRDAVGEGR